MDKQVNIGSATLFYRDEGKGLPVVLIHGFAEDSALWDKLVEPLTGKMRFVIPDLPGCGRSSALAEETSMEELAEYIRQLLDHEKIDRCVIVAHSMGGYASLAFAEKYPERLSGLGLFHSTSYPDSEEKKATRRKGIEFIRKNGAALFIRQSTPNLFSTDTRSAHPEIVEEMIRRYSGFSSDSLIYYYEAMIRRPDRTAVLKKLNHPVLFVIGIHDQAVLPEHALQQSHIPALSHVHILERSAHLGMLEETERSIEIMHSFINFVTSL